MRRLMLLLALLATMMLVTSPVLAHMGGGNHGNRYQENWYPNNYFKYCEPDGAQYYGDNRANNNSWCDTYYKEYTTKWTNGKKYYYVHVYYEWRTPNGNRQTWDDWYYCQYHKYNDQDHTRPYFTAWVTYEPNDNSYWEDFYYWQSPSH